MGLKEGTLQPLVERGCSIPIDNLCETALHHMLQALDFLAVNHIIHRDLKPENILYVSQRGQYQFQLGDFGLSNRQFIATTFAGSLLYMAPEIIQQGSQTPKVDIWSLYVTILWTLDVKGFRDGWRTLQGYDDIQRAILLASKADSVSIVQEMARPDPEKRASAAQMLIKLFGGRGLTTPRGQIPPLTLPAEADGGALATAALTPMSSTQPSLGDVEMRMNSVTAATTPPSTVRPSPGDVQLRMSPVAGDGHFRISKNNRSPRHDRGRRL